MQKVIKDRSYFMSRVSIDNNGCWNWKLAKFSNGYGMIKEGGRAQHTHRVTYELFVGKIQEGLLVCHKCDNRICCNPEHIFIGTQMDNMVDMVKKGRSTTVRNYGNKANSRRILVDGMEFKSMISAGKYFGIRDNSVRKRFKGKIVYLD